MNTLYLECHMGASGDMLLGALLGLLEDPQPVLDKLNGLGLPGVRVHLEPSVKCGITGLHASVTVGGAEEESHDYHAGEHAHHHHAHDHDPHEHHEHDHHHHDHVHQHGDLQQDHHHAGIQSIRDIIQGLSVSSKVKEDALAVYGLIAEAEAQVHGKPVEQVHFHEVGAMDAVADIVGVSLVMEQLAPEQVIASPITTGFGQVRCAHGILPVPTPATALILRGIPSLAGRIEGELCTPTGAALLKHFASAFQPRPAMRIEKIAYGMGKKDFAAANCLRAYLGHTEQTRPRVAELRCNLDDMRPEALAHAVKLLMEAGALDAWLTPIQMKKGRPGQLLSCLCPEDQAEAFARLMLKHTSTIGLRQSLLERYTMASSWQTMETEHGSVRIKTSTGYGLAKRKIEYEDLASYAAQAGLSLQEAEQELLQKLD